MFYLKHVLLYHVTQSLKCHREQNWRCLTFLLRFIQGPVCPTILGKIRLHVPVFNCIANSKSLIFVFIELS